MLCIIIQKVKGKWQLIGVFSSFETFSNLIWNSWPKIIIWLELLNVKGMGMEGSVREEKQGECEGEEKQSRHVSLKYMPEHDWVTLA